MYSSVDNVNQKITFVNAVRIKKPLRLPCASSVPDSGFPPLNDVDRPRFTDVAVDTGSKISTTRCQFDFGQYLLSMILAFVAVCL